MKTRKLIATILGLAVLACIIFGLAAIAMYCDQVFPTSNVPAMCTDDSLTMALLNGLGWILLFLMPISVWLLYARFGWPRSNRTSDKSSSSRSE